MKLFTLSTAITALVAVVTANPIGHLDLAKRAIIATQTIVSGSSTYVELTDAYEVTVTETVTASYTDTQTFTDASYVFTYSGDNSSIISRLQSAFSDLFDDLEEPMSSEDLSSIASEVSSAASEASSAASEAASAASEAASAA
ncbi:uncharacterized protein BX663DRAFT_494323, partial [Cokeromyces recurvatus]|uniref:uncharacterized protein n=1 Tax=Cokeromyces recurvatus TaxID=90255 RepID=UPI00221F5284